MGKKYKDTILLPKTDFPMKAGLTEREPKALAQWEKDNLYQQIQDARAEAPKFILHDGPPFANGDVHMGTALNKTLKDLIVKSKSMAGFKVPFIPGWDCHGLPIEFKVVKESRDLDPLEIRKRSAKYAGKYINIQRRQFRRLGVFGDWDNPYLTLSRTYEAEELRTFAKFIDKDLVYQSKKPVFWSTGAQTALAEAEVDYQDKTSPAIFVEFPLASGEFAGKASVVIWTTTPWTLPANLAVAVHPRHSYSIRPFTHNEKNVTKTFLIADELVDAFGTATGWQASGEPLTTCKGQELEGLLADHPFLPRQAQVILGDFVTMDTGTGSVHIAPGHGQDDYAVGRQYGLDLLSPVDDHGHFTEEVGVPEWVGKYVFGANPDVIAMLESKDRLLGQEDYEHSYPHCWRSKTPIVFRAIEQFFIKIDDIRTAALKEIDEVNWLPKSARNRIYGTVESRPDWCISRQRTWGVPLPVFYTVEGDPIIDADVVRRFAALVEEHGTNIWFELSDAEIAAKLDLPEGTTRHNDTLDVWIDSGVSHQAVLRSHPELHFPADLYIEATDQHRGWFQSSLLTSMAINGESPYKTCLTHGFVVDVDGKKISKSSSYEKPMDAEHFVNKYGADIVRLWVSSINFTDEVPFSEEMFHRLSDTYRRIRNTLRILLANLHDFDPAEDAVQMSEMTDIDRWVLHRMNGVITACTAAYESYEFHKVYHALNQFCAVDLSSLYVDITKDRMYCNASDSARRRATQTVMHQVLENMTPLLAPIIVFTADETWKHMGHADSVHLATFPKTKPEWDNAAVEADVEKLLELRSLIGQQVEQARQDKLIGKSLEAGVTVTVADAAHLETLTPRVEALEEFFIVSSLTFVGGDANKAELVKTENGKCERCWKHADGVGNSTEHPTLCTRCVTVVA